MNGFPSLFLFFFFIVVILIIIQIIWRIIRESSPAKPSPQPTVIKEKVVREVVKIRCPYCGNLYNEGLDRCPHCGGKR